MQNNYEIQNDFFYFQPCTDLHYFFAPTTGDGYTYCVRERIASKWGRGNGVRLKSQPLKLNILGDRARRTVKPWITTTI